MTGVFELMTGVGIGGLALSAGWGFFWLAVGLVGVRRGTCSWRVVVNSLTVGLVPLALLVGVWWWVGADAGWRFGIGLSAMPIVLLGLGLRQTPDGQRAAVHMLGGVHQLMDEILGSHRGCGGCAHEQDGNGCP